MDRVQRILRFLSFHFEIILRTSDAATRYVRNTYNAHPHRRALVGERKRQRERERSGRTIFQQVSNHEWTLGFIAPLERFLLFSFFPVRSSLLAPHHGSVHFLLLGRKKRASERASERERERERERSKDSFRNRSLIKEKKKFRTRGENIVEDNAIDGCIPRRVFLCAFFLSLSSFSRLQRSLNPSRPRRA